MRRPKLRGRFDVVVGLVKHILRPEFTTPEGRVNLIVLVVLAAILLPAWGLDLAPPLIRLLRPGYSSGLPSIISIAVVFAIPGLACVVIVGLFRDK